MFDCENIVVFISLTNFAAFFGIYRLSLSSKIEKKFPKMTNLDIYLMIGNFY